MLQNKRCGNNLCLLWSPERLSLRHDFPPVMRNHLFLRLGEFGMTRRRGKQTVTVGHKRRNILTDAFSRKHSPPSREPQKPHCSVDIDCKSRYVRVLKACEDEGGERVHPCAEPHQAGSPWYLSSVRYRNRPYLQHLESRIIVNVLLYCQKRDITALPIHEREETTERPRPSMGPDHHEGR